MRPRCGACRGQRVRHRASTTRSKRRGAVSKPTSCASPRAWRPQMKTRDPARLRLAAARHLFARYPVARASWSRSGSTAAPSSLPRSPCASAGTSWRPAAARSIVLGGRRLAVAQGGAMRSSMRRRASPSRRRCGRRSRVPIATIPPSCGGSRVPGSCRRRAPELAFRREVARFFCAHPTTGRGDGRSARLPRGLPRASSAVQPEGPHARRRSRRQMHAWHHDLAAIARIEAARLRAEAAQAPCAWTSGAHARRPMAAGRAPRSQTGHWTPAAKDRSKREVYLVVQLRTAADLVAETQSHATLRRELRAQSALPATRRSGRSGAAPKARPRGS